MSNLIITVIAIAFFAAIMFAGSGYINYSSVTTVKDKTELSAALVQLSTGVGTYKIMHDLNPTSWTDFIPDVIGEPILPDHMDWTDFSLNRTTGFNEACIEASLEVKEDLRAILNVQKDMSDGTFYISDTCGHKADLLPETYPSIKTITYIIR